MSVLSIADQTQFYSCDEMCLGPVVSRDDIASSIGPFQVLQDYGIRYPDVVVRALEELYAEYNRSFTPLVQKNQEWDSDYRYCVNGSPTNFAVQVDMVGLSPSFLGMCANLDVPQVREMLRDGVYEIDNSLAMYQLLECLFQESGKESFFKLQFRKSLDAIRDRFNKDIALLAVTDQKHQAMLESEFGVAGAGDLSNDTVKRLSGFDHFFGPREFSDHVKDRDGCCDYLLYVRSSDPVSKLKKPEAVVDHPLLGDPGLRRVIKAYSLTFNVDAPEMPYESRINDTKEYMPLMRMGFPADTWHEIVNPDFAKHLERGNAYAEYNDSRLAVGFADYLRSKEVDPTAVELGRIAFRGKPMKGTYGCYGHVAGALTSNKFRNDFRRNLRIRGRYVVQPEIRAPVVTNTTDGQTYTYIDRNFFSCSGCDEYRFLGGFRSLIPVGSFESFRGRNHGNRRTVWAEIL